MGVTPDQRFAQLGNKAGTSSLTRDEVSDLVAITGQLFKDRLTPRNGDLPPFARAINTASWHTPGCSRTWLAAS